MKIIDAPPTIHALLQHARGENDVWPEPETLAPPLLPVMPFDADRLLPKVLKARCMDIAYRMQCPIDFVAVASLCMLGSVIGAGCAVRPKQHDDWTEVPNLWGGVVARPGKLKSPAISEGLAPLQVLERDAEAAYQSALAAHAAQKMDKKFESDSLKKRLAKSEGDPQGTDEYERLKRLQTQEPDAPRLRRYRTNDSTIEKLGELLAGNQRGMLVERDELIGLLSCFEQQGHEGDRAFYLEGWNGRGPYRADRIGRGEVYVPHLCISVFGGIQPAKLQEYLSNLRAEGNDGFMQRFQLVVYPDDIEDPIVVDQAPDAEATAQLSKIVQRLGAFDACALGAKRDHDGSIPYLRFDDKEAQPLFFAWLEGLDRAIAAEDDPIIAEHRAKYRKLVPALALIFHLVVHAEKKATWIPPISAASLEMAVAWADYLLTHARRIYRLGLSPSSTAAAALASKITKGDLTDGFSVRDAYRPQWANLTTTELVAAGCRDLEAAGWVRRRPQPKREKGGRNPSPIYDINPQLKK